MSGAPTIEVRPNQLLSKPKARAPTIAAICNISKVWQILWYLTTVLNNLQHTVSIPHSTDGLPH